MPANLSQNIFDKSRLFRRLQFQQGKPVGDYELNELQDILHEFGADTREFMGAYGFWGDSAYVESTGNPNEILIRKGLILTGDSVIVIPEDVTLDNGDGITTPILSRTDEVYFQLGVQEVNRLQYPDIVNPVTGQELALRIQYVTTFGVAEGGNYPTIPAEDQFILFARLNRGAGNATVLPGEVEDLRSGYSDTFINGVADDTLRVTLTGGLGFDKEGGEVRVYGSTFTIASGSHVLVDDSLNFLYISEAGVFTNTTTRPTKAFLELYRITTENGLILNVEDRRRFAPSGAFGTLLAEIIAARGTLDSLDERLDVSLNDDGTIRDCAVELNSLGSLCPHPDDPESLYVVVDAGQGSYGTSALDWPGGPSPVFVAPVTDPRIDLLYLDNLGLLAITAGVEAPIPVAPTHASVLPIAEITLIPGQTAITASDIRDVRPLFNIAVSGGGGPSLVGGPGVFIEVDGVTIGNQSPKPAWTFSSGTFTWSAGTSTLTWSATINVQFTDEASYVINTIAAGSVTLIADGDYVYADMNRAGGAITLVRNAGGAPAPATDRILFGRRLGADFYLQGEGVFKDSSTLAGAATAMLGPYNLTKNQLEGLMAANAPTSSNRVLVASDIGTINLADLADVSTDEAAAFNAAGAAGATAGNRLAVLADLTSLSMIRGVSTGALGAGAAVAFTHSTSTAANWVLLRFGFGSAVNMGVECIYLFNRATNQIYGFSRCPPAFGAVSHNGTVVVFNITNIGVALNPIVLVGHTTTTITVQNFSGTAFTVTVIGIG